MEKLKLEADNADLEKRDEGVPALDEKIADTGSEKLKVLVVEPDKEPYVKLIDNDYRALQKEVGGTFQGIYPYSDAVSILCNDDGKLLGLPLNRALRDEKGKIYDILSGVFLVVGLTTDDYCSLTTELIDKYTCMFKNPEIHVKLDNEIIVIPYRCNEL